MSNIKVEYSQLPVFLDGITPEIGYFGGRRFKVVTGRSLTFRELIETIKSSIIEPKIPLLVISKLRKLDKNAYNKCWLIQRILTFIWDFFENRGFDKEKEIRLKTPKNLLQQDQNYLFNLIQDPLNTEGIKEFNDEFANFEKLAGQTWTAQDFNFETFVYALCHYFETKFSQDELILGLTSLSQQFTHQGLKDVIAKWVKEIKPLNIKEIERKEKLKAAKSKLEETEKKKEEIEKQIDLSSQEGVEIWNSLVRASRNRKEYLSLESTRASAKGKREAANAIKGYDAQWRDKSECICWVGGIERQKYSQGLIEKVLEEIEWNPIMIAKIIKEAGLGSWISALPMNIILNVVQEKKSDAVPLVLAYLYLLNCNIRCIKDLYIDHLDAVKIEVNKILSGFCEMTNLPGIPHFKDRLTLISCSLIQSTPIQNESVKAIDNELSKVSFLTIATYYPKAMAVAIATSLNESLENTFNMLTITSKSVKDFHKSFEIAFFMPNQLVGLMAKDKRIGFENELANELKNKDLFGFMCRKVENFYIESSKAGITKSRYPFASRSLKLMNTSYLIDKPKAPILIKSTIALFDNCTLPFFVSKVFTESLAEIVLNIFGRQKLLRCQSIAPAMEAKLKAIFAALNPEQRKKYFP